MREDIAKNVARTLRDARRYARRNAAREDEEETWWCDHGFLIADDLDQTRIRSGVPCRAEGVMDQHEYTRMQRYDAEMRKRR